MRTLLTWTIALVALGLACNSASATHVSISGTHGSSEIKNTCLNNGGLYQEAGSTYSCTKACKGGKCSVVCSGGKCDGYVPRGGRPSHTLGGILHPPSGVKTTGGAKGRHLGHGRVVKTSGLKTKAMYRRSTGPTNPNGPDIPGKNKGPFTTPEHHSGRHR
jgi:hypothetical protein